MKRLLLLTALMAPALAAMAQTQWLHVFNSEPKDFLSMPMERVDKISFSATGKNFTRMYVTEKSGEEHTVDMEGITTWRVGQNLPTLYITTTPSIYDISDKTTEYQGILTIDGAGIYDDLESTEIIFRGRGNSTLNYPKKPYRLKFEKKTKLLDFRKAKSYVLLANWIDPSFMRNYVAFSVAGLVDMPYANHIRPVDVYLNGELKGTYMLTEKVGFNNGSVDLTKEEEAESVLFELDTNFDEYYQSLSDVWQLPVLLKDPDAPEDYYEARQWWEGWMAEFNAMERAVQNHANVADHIDYNTLAKYLLIYNVTCNQELNHPKSVYMWKTRGGKFQFGPAWDFDWAFGYQQTYMGIEGGGNTEENRRRYDEACDYFRQKYGDEPIIAEYEGESLFWFYGNLFVWDSVRGSYVSWLLDQYTYLPSYQSPLLGIGKNTQGTHGIGHGGEFFMELIVGNEEFMAEYVKVWEQFEARIDDFWTDFEAYAADIEVTSARDATIWTFNKDLPHSKAVTELRKWLKERLTFIADPENNYGLY